MSADRSAIDAVMGAVQQVADARAKAMMGGWLVYVDEVLVGQVNEGEFFVKASPFGLEHAPELEARPPYPGAKDALVVPLERLDDGEWLHALLAGSAAALRRPPRATSRRSGGPPAGPPPD